MEVQVNSMKDLKFKLTVLFYTSLFFAEIYVCYKILKWIL